MTSFDVIDFNLTIKNTWSLENKNVYIPKKNSRWKKIKQKQHLN